MTSYRRRTFLLAWGLMTGLGLWLSGCAVTREPLLGFDFWRTMAGQMEGRKLTAEISEVDDLGDVWVINGFTMKNEQFSPVLRAEWLNVDGQAQGDLTRYLDQGLNYVVFTLFNKVFKGWSPAKSGGKYRCNFKLYLDDALVYQKKLYKDYNEEALIFAAIFKVEGAREGRLKVLSLSEEERTRLMNIVQGPMARLLHSTADVADFDWSVSGFRTVIADPEMKKLLKDLERLPREIKP
ncbi:MAG: hypothetical protein AB1641_20730 [Thermodesulfobacteriota bacterium]